METAAIVAIAGAIEAGFKFFTKVLEGKPEGLQEKEWERLDRFMTPFFKLLKLEP